MAIVKIPKKTVIKQAQQERFEPLNPVHVQRVESSSQIRILRASPKPPPVRQSPICVNQAAAEIQTIHRPQRPPVKNAITPAKVKRALGKTRFKYALAQPLIASVLFAVSIFLASGKPGLSLRDPVSAGLFRGFASLPPTTDRNNNLNDLVIQDETDIALLEQERPTRDTDSTSSESPSSIFSSVPDASSAFKNALSKFSGAAQIVAAPTPAPPVISAPLASTPAQIASVNIERKVYDKMSQVKFIAGMIAVHLPTITDCGLVAKEIVESSAEKNVDPFYVAAIISVESRFGAQARSKAGAVGLMQLLPATARDVLETKTGKRGNPLLTDPHTNIKLGIAYIRDLELKYRGNRFYALAAYNWGPANVDNALVRGASVPSGVRKYAQTILERTLNWRRHFDKAQKSASSLNLTS